MSEDKISPPSLNEASTAFWVAAYSKHIVRQIIETGHPEGDDFMSLCNALVELESKTIGGLEFSERAEELFQLSRKKP